MSELTLERVIKKKIKCCFNSLSAECVYIFAHFCFILIKGLISTM